ncbi:IQ domain-containing protein E isoform X2 [Girardinichthys multiradiatus]|uniref:IQ domain-containing protein E isoform X2 n=1 Tax=Girardinichthys multiradiatus TaxID=208333 RepID=UPI001FAD634B|nr:IQ domain-containing protein E isoform X2 [Girardinichthys multiradiatus]
MFSATKMSLVASDVPTDEDCDELLEDGFTLPADISGKSTSRKKSAGKPPPSPRSPYLFSLNMNSKRAAVAAWRLPRPSLGDTRGDISREHFLARQTSLSNGHESDDSPQLLTQKSSIRKHLFASNGFAIGACDHKDKEGMYDEIIRLKKSLQVQKSDNQQTKAKLRRLEEDNAKRVKQIEELLDPTKGSEYSRSLVDKKKEGSVIVNGLKQRILKLEQQCREKENALSKLQSELRTINLEELKITVETYFEEIQRLRILLDAAEKSRAESKCSQRQQKALNSTVHRLAENVKHLQQENAALREELDTDSPAAGIKGYREWSRQRLLRRLLEVERRLEDSRRHTPSAKSSARLDKKVQTMPTEAPGLTMATEAVVSVGTVTEQEREVSDLREHLSQLEEEISELQERLTNKNDELMELRKETDELVEETEQLKAEQKEQLDTMEQQHRQELEQLLSRIVTLEEDRRKIVQAEVCSTPPTITEHLEDAQHRTGQEEEEERAPGHQEKGEEEEEALGMDAEMTKKEKAASIIQTNWRQHRQKDIVMLQSVMRGHLFRDSWLKDLLKNTEKKAEVSLNDRNSGGGGLDVAALTLIQSAFRGHLARCSLAIKSSGFVVPSPAENYPLALVPRGADLPDAPSRKGSMYLSKNGQKEEDLDPISITDVSSRSHTQAHGKLRSTAEFDADAAVGSDDSDDIIVSPSRPLRSRETLML